MLAITQLTLVIRLDFSVQEEHLAVQLTLVMLLSVVGQLSLQEVEVAVEQSLISLMQVVSLLPVEEPMRVLLTVLEK
jgi:hypothetical protein